MVTRWGGSDDLVPPGRDRHYKGGEYVVFGMCRFADGEGEGTLGVVYMPCYDVEGEKISVRSLEGWLDPAPDGDPRFRWVADH